MKLQVGVASSPGSKLMPEPATGPDGRFSSSGRPTVPPSSLKDGRSPAARHRSTGSDLLVGGRFNFRAAGGSSAHQPDTGRKQPYDPGEVARHPDVQERRAVRDREAGRPGGEEQASSGHAEQTLPPRRQP